MIRQWEILYIPTVSEKNRYRISLWADAGDMAKVRNLFPDRAGVVWVPKRKPYNCSFFLYNLLDREKADLEKMLSGEIPFPEGSETGVGKKKGGKKLSFEDTQEVMIDDAVPSGEKDMSTGLGKNIVSEGKLEVGYIVPEYLTAAAEEVHRILDRTLIEKKVSVEFVKKILIPYASLSLMEIHRIIQQCKENSVRHMVAVGEPSEMHALIKIAKENRILVRPVSESVLDKHLWLSIIAEILSFE